MQAVKAYYNGDTFTPFKPVKIPKGSHAIITILDFPINEEQYAEDEGQGVQVESRIEWLNRLEAAIDLAVDEELPDWAFQRSKEMRPTLDLRD